MQTVRSWNQHQTEDQKIQERGQNRDFWSATYVPGACRWTTQLLGHEVRTVVGDALATIRGRDVHTEI